MTPTQFAKEECANHQPDGSCLGIMINADLSTTQARPLPKCLLAEGKRCPYFEQCVAPMADMASDPRRAAALQAAVAEYRQATNQKAPANRSCPDCGAALQKGKQRCPKCAAFRRRAANRARQERRRETEDVLSRKVSKNTPKTPMISGGKKAVFQNAIEDSHPPQNDQTLRDRTEAA